MSDRDESSSNLDTENALDFQDKLDHDCFVSGKVKLLKSLEQIVYSISLEHILKYFLMPTQKTTLLTHQRHV